MTRLNQAHIEHINDQLTLIDEELMAKCGYDLRGVALRTVGMSKRQASAAFAKKRFMTVPITTGQGIITGFSDTVCAILRHIGFDTRTTRQADVAGISEAYAESADVIFLADDLKFIAVNLLSKTVVDNDHATGIGFAGLLDLMAKGVSGKSCDVIGCGNVGTAAAMRLAKMGARIRLCDLDSERERALSEKIEKRFGKKVERFENVTELVQIIPYMVDASPAENIISARVLRDDTVIVSPGVPHGLTDSAVKRMGNRFYHDCLPLGVCVMAFGALIKHQKHP